MSITKHSSKQQIISFLRTCTKGDVVDVIKYINDEIDSDDIDFILKISGTADTLVAQLSAERKVTQAILFQSVDNVLDVNLDEDEDEEIEEDEQFDDGEEKESIDIDPSSTKKKMCDYLEFVSTKEQIIEIINYMNEEIDADELEIKFNTSGTKEVLVQQLREERELTRDLLFEAIDDVIPDSEDEEDDDVEADDRIEIDPSSTKQKMCDFIEFVCSKEEIVEIINYMNEEIDADELEAKFNTSGTKEGLVEQLREERELTRDLLFEAIDDVIPDIDDDQEYEYDEDYDDDFSKENSRENHEEQIRYFHEREQEHRKEARDYQIEACEKLLSLMLKSGHGKGTLGIATGGGKTKIANDAIYQYIEKNPHKNILWISNKGWDLLFQAAADLNRRYQLRAIMGKIGGQPSHILSKCLDENYKAKINYSTIQTIKNQPQLIYKADIVFMDESHWGQGEAMYNSIMNDLNPEAKIIGLTATPKGLKHFPVIYSKSFMELVREGYLSTPLVKQYNTNCIWNPVLDHKRMISRKSLNELGSNEARNREIVNYYIRNKKPDNLGKTLIFATDKNQCKQLFRLFENNRINCAYVSTYLKESQNAEAKQKFRTGAIDVLINIEMLTTGIDIPDIKTIFLARPTESEILYLQMIGRGSRIIPGVKEEFNIIEFVDKVSDHSELLVSSRKVFNVDPSATIEKSFLDKNIKPVYKRDYSKSIYERSQEFQNGLSTAISDGFSDFRTNLRVLSLSDLNSIGSIGFSSVSHHGLSEKILHRLNLLAQSCELSFDASNQSNLKKEIDQYVFNENMGFWTQFQNGFESKEDLINTTEWAFQKTIEQPGFISILKKIT